jgi:hypothetical protein
MRTYLIIFLSPLFNQDLCFLKSSEYLPVQQHLPLDCSNYSAYWEEWNLFGLRGGITGFLILHLPLVFMVLYGLILVFQQTFNGLIFSCLLSAGGIIAFIIHMIFIKKGRREFKVRVSIVILISTLVVSLVQGALSIVLLLG